MCDTSEVPGLPWTEYSDVPYDDVIVSIWIHMGTYSGERCTCYLNLNHTGYLCDDIDMPAGMNPDNLLEDIISGAIFTWGSADHHVERVQLYQPPHVVSPIELLQHMEGEIETEFGQIVMHLELSGGHITH